MLHCSQINFKDLQKFKQMVGKINMFMGTYLIYLYDIFIIILIMLEGIMMNWLLLKFIMLNVIILLMVGFIIQKSYYQLKSYPTFQIDYINHVNINYMFYNVINKDLMNLIIIHY